MRNLKIVLLSTGAFLFTACGSGGGSNTATPAPQASSPGPSGQSTALSYSNVNKQVLTPHCNYCHGSNGGNDGGLNLETYTNVLSRLSRVRSEVAQGSMPKDHRLPANLENLLISWIDAGAPQ